MSHGRPPGLPKTGGRVKGTPNKTSLDIRALAQMHGPAVIERLLRLSGCMRDSAGHPVTGSDSDTVQVMAMRELLDRGYGKATQMIGGDPDAGPVHMTFQWLEHPPPVAAGIVADVINGDPDV